MQILKKYCTEFDYENVQYNFVSYWLNTHKEKNASWDL
jgi:hypothetical protein